MKYLFTSFFLCCFVFASKAQHTLKLTVTSNDHERLAGATVAWKEQNRAVQTDSTGNIVFINIPAGVHTFVITHIGFEEKIITVTFPLTGPDNMDIVLEPATEETADEVIVTATRTSRTISNLPTRTEVISGEELAEKGNMKPGDIRMMLNESTGIQTQQTSATSYSSGIRIQGLDGRYTQILRDGYPLYAGFSSGLSLLQISPLDLKQVEVIKGSASTLYGGGAIAGLVNLVSKTPGEKRELDFMANGTSAKGLDLSAFYSELYGKMGLTVFGSRNSNAPFDPAGIGLTAIPKFERYTINPRLFLYGKKTTADAGVSYVTEDRMGGNMNYIKHGGTGYFEQNNTDRLTAQLGIVHHLNENNTIQLKTSYSRFDRVINIPTYTFDALQQSSFTELTWNRKGLKTDWVIGGNMLTDDLNERQQSTDPLRNYHYNTIGLFIQNTWSLNKQLVIESGLRGDHVNDYGFELLPRVSVMYKVSPAFTTRLGGGLGYKTPTIFTEEAERLQFQHILPIAVNNTNNERSAGGNWDLNYRTHFGELGVSLNNLFFYTKLNRPLVLTDAGNGKMAFDNASGYIDTKGIETNVRFTYADFKLFIGYTYTDANTHFNEKQWLPLTARHRLNNVLMYEVEDKWKIGLEAYYYSRQQLSDGSFGQSYWVTGLMAEKLWEHVSIFINFENFSNTRQTKFDTIYTGSIDNPVFKDIYAPLDGFVVNGGIKIKL
ncbi:collagen-binding protein [Niastella yeongjuensis]|uniref:Collagen-binding protein n=1 Tax=Niastella yeongjuensis TaxID=354355 RepID=A0A1V9E9K1_9BACT|nr:TonB-dependent receptor [Niastella yeongjuensis]OQP42800.1 collagen-binding protein [Niastella yeongjuensis]SEO54586.1 iron complex outermembrane recepter protein [Niastella yeongjuensis]